MDTRPRTSTLEPGEVAARFVAWLAPRVRADQTPSVLALEVPATAGFSSETLLVDMRWTVEGEPRTAAYVVRLPPTDDAFHRARLDLAWLVFFHEYFAGSMVTRPSAGSGPA